MSEDPRGAASGDYTTGDIVRAKYETDEEPEWWYVSARLWNYDPQVGGGPDRMPTVFDHRQYILRSVRSLGCETKRVTEDDLNQHFEVSPKEAVPDLDDLNAGDVEA